jgi:hypothetical protein
MLLLLQRFSSFQTSLPQNRCEPAVGSKLAQGKGVLMFQYPTIFKLKCVQKAGNGGPASGGLG